jgi:hypothetical protein
LNSILLMKRLNAVPVPAVGVAALVGEVGKAGGGVLGLLAGGGGGGEGGLGEALPPLPRVANGLMVRLLWVGHGVYKDIELCMSRVEHTPLTAGHGTSLPVVVPCLGLAGPRLLRRVNNMRTAVAIYPVKALSGWTVRGCVREREGQIDRSQDVVANGSSANGRLR